MLFDKVLEDTELFGIRRLTICENGIEVGIHTDLFVDSDLSELDQARICILKLDAHPAYNSLHSPNPPKIVDNLVAVKCCDGSVSIYLIELRDSRGRRPTRRLNVGQIEEKFITAAEDFVGRRYADIFDSMTIKDVRAYLVADPWGMAGQDSDSNLLFEKKLKSSALDAYASRRPLSVLGRRVLINPVLPPNPVIAPC